MVWLENHVVFSPKKLEKDSLLMKIGWNFKFKTSGHPVTTVSIKDIEEGSARMPFYNISAWKQAQKRDPDLKRCYAQITEGTRPGKKEKNLRVLRRYFQIATISEAGLLVHCKANPFGPDMDLIIVPKELASGLISALHLQLGHPTKTQFKKV